MTLSGRTFGIGLAVAFAGGVAAGSFAAGWAKARGVSVVSTMDAGVSVRVDAGVKAQSDCAVTVDHWTTVYVPGPVRYLPAPDGGVAIAQQPEVVTVLVPDVRLTGSSAALAHVQDDAQAQASASVVVAPVAPERHWEAGPAVLYGGSTHEVLVGVEVGFSGGPFGVRLQALKGPGDVYGGGALVWRW